MNDEEDELPSLEVFEQANKNKLNSINNNPNNINHIQENKIENYKNLNPCPPISNINAPPPFSINQNINDYNKNAYISKPNSPLFLFRNKKSFFSKIKK